MKRLTQSGSHVIALALLIVALGAVVFTGYTVSHRNKKTPVASTNAQTAGVPATIKTKADLAATATSLDNASASLNSSVDTGSLDSSMNDLL